MHFLKVIIPWVASAAQLISSVFFGGEIAVPSSSWASGSALQVSPSAILTIDPPPTLTALKPVMTIVRATQKTKLTVHVLTHGSR